MEILAPRHIKSDEAKWLGIDEGWYGTKASGTLMTDVFPSVEECEKEITRLLKRSKELAKAARVDPPETPSGAS